MCAAISVMLHSFIGTQKQAVKVSLEKHFKKYLHYKKDSFELLHFVLHDMVEAEVKLRRAKAQVRPALSGRLLPPSLASSTRCPALLVGQPLVCSRFLRVVCRRGCAATGPALSAGRPCWYGRVTAPLCGFAQPRVALASFAAERKGDGESKSLGIDEPVEIEMEVFQNRVRCKRLFPASQRPLTTPFGWLLVGCLQANELQIGDLVPYFNSDRFRSAGYTIDKRRKVIIKSFE